MDNHFMLTDDILWDYADGLLSTAEKAQVEAYLTQHPEQAARLEAVLTEKRAFRSLQADSPDKGFSDRLMAAWTAEQAHARASLRKPDRVLSFIALGFGVLLLFVFFAVWSSAPEASIHIPEEYLPQPSSLNLPALLDNPIWRVGIMLAMVLLGLQVLDKYLQQRKQPGLL